VNRSTLVLLCALLAAGCGDGIIAGEDETLTPEPTPEPHPDAVFDGIEGTITYDIAYTEGSAVDEVGTCSEVYSMSGVNASENAPGELAELQELCPNCTELLSVFFTTEADECVGGAGMPADNRLSFDRVTQEGSAILWWKADDDWFELSAGDLDYDLTTIVYDNPDDGGWGPWGGNVTTDDPCRFVAPCRWDGVYTVQADLGSNTHPDDVETE
jgi:hypothetical protein